MPITALSLTTRTSAGAPLNQTQFDGNLTAIQTAVNALITQVAAQHKDDGTLKDNAVQTALQVTNAILTLAKLAVLSGGDLGAFLRANPSTGAIEAVHLFTHAETDDTVVNPTAAGTVTLSTFTIANVPAGDVMVICNLLGKANAGANGGTISLMHGANVLDQVASHGVDAVGASWQSFGLAGTIADFAGGTLTLTVKFETSESTSDILFGVVGEDRFGRRVRVLGGL